MNSASSGKVLGVVLTVASLVIPPLIGYGHLLAQVENVQSQGTTSLRAHVEMELRDQRALYERLARIEQSQVLLLEEMRGIRVQLSKR